jgi:hypothetical protein
MPPRFSYWTIIADGLPTAFRAAEREELIPTFTRIKQKHPDAHMKWFARGKLWDSPESARREADARRQADTRRAPKTDRDWRPGGAHRDPRQPYRDAKKGRNAANRKKKFERRQGWGRTRDAQPPTTPPPREWRAPRAFQKKVFVRNQRPTERPAPPPPPDETRREPRPREGTEPTPPPRPSEPVIPPPGPPERGRRPARDRRKR